MNAFEERRKAAKMTQEAVAAALGIDRSTVAKWETGRALPTAEKLLRVARLYGCTADALIQPREDGKTA